MNREAEHIQSIIDSKEEEDKGLFKQRSGSVKVDKSCLSCAGVPSHTMKMFKMACISYKPSPIQYR